MVWTSANGPKCPVSPEDRDEIVEPLDVRAAVIEESFRRLPDIVVPVDYHPAGKIVQDNGSMRFAFIEGAMFALSLSRPERGGAA
jgi:DNA/RNA-binding domain of Phe-tRNA-synthetase-like protein